MADYRSIAIAVVISSLISSLVAYGVVTGVQPTTIQPTSNELSSVKSSLSSLDTTLKGISSQVTDLNQKVSDLQKANADLSKQMSDVRGSVSTLSTEVSNIRTNFEKVRAYQIFKSFMVDSGSNLATVISSQIVDQMDQRGQIPSIFGYGKDQIKSALRDAISTLLKALVPSSAWTESTASSATSNIYTTSLKTAFPIKVNVFGVDVTIARVVLVATGEVDIVNGSVSNLRVTSVSLA